MQSLIHELNQLCSKFPYKEKIILVDSHSIGEQINEAYIKAGNQAINLKYRTVFDLAQNLVELVSADNLNVLDQTVGVHFTYTLLAKMKKKGVLCYFHGMEITPSFSYAIYHMIQALRLAGYTRDNLNKAVFITPSKAYDIAKILFEYEETLHAESFVDKAALLTKALEYAEVDSSKIWVLQSHLQLTRLEEQFLHKVLPESVVKLPLTPVFGIQPPEGTSLSSIRTGEPSQLSYLYQLEEASGQPNLDIFTAKTEELEVKSILEKIKKDRAPLDESVVYYTSADTYSTLFYQLSQKLDIPVTFGDGLSISFSRPGRLVTGILHWIQSNYSVQSFLQLLNDGVLELGDAAPSKARIAKVLRDLKIGWSQERYLSFLDNKIEQLNGRVQENPSNEARITELTWLKHWFSTIFKKLPLLETLMNYQAFLKGMSFLLKNNVKTSSALDEISKSALLEEIEKILPFVDEPISSYELFEKVQDLLLSIKVNSSRPKPGHLHIASYKSGVYNSRSHVFVVGLDNKKFPGHSGEDPLLLDTERVQLHAGLPLMREKGLENLYTLLQVLAGTTGSVTVSYCHFDINGNRVMNPAFIVLQCYRMMTGNKEAEFKELKSLPSALVATEILEDKDYWSEQLTNEETTTITEGIFAHFESIQHGLKAEMARNEASFSEYEGKIAIDAALFDPCLNQEKTMSPSKLEALAKCPYSYFLQEVLRLRPVEEVSFDSNRWMDAATRGNLLHSIFEHFYKHLQQEEAQPVYAIHLDKLLSLATGLIEEQKEILPPPNERVYVRE